MIDEHRLLLQPLAPAFLADGFHDSRTERTRKRRSLKGRAGLSAPNALHVWHVFLYLCEPAAVGYINRR
jgi:hypothetical protein